MDILIHSTPTARENLAKKIDAAATYERVTGLCLFGLLVLLVLTGSHYEWLALTQ